MSERCAATVRYDAYGRIEPRRCMRPSVGRGPFCTLHATRVEQGPVVEASPGGWCVWCGDPAMRYASSRAPAQPIALCLLCARALKEALAHEVALRGPHRR